MALSAAHVAARVALHRRMLLAANQPHLGGVSGSGSSNSIISNHMLVRSSYPPLARYASSSRGAGVTPQPNPVQNVPSPSPLSATPQSALPKTSPTASTPPPLPSPPTPSPSSFVHSPASQPKRSSRSLFGRLVSYSLFIFGGTFLVTYYLDSRSAIHRWIAMPFLHSFVDAEDGQKLAIQLLKSGLAPKDYTGDDQALATTLFGQPLVNPIGLAAGFDKQAEAVDGLFDLGFGIVEVGSVTPEPQPGNPRPRYFRVPSQSACINRFGFNSDGHQVVLERLLTRIKNYLILHPQLIPADFLPDMRSPEVDPRMTRFEAVQQAASRATQDPAVASRVLDHLGLPRSLRPGHILSVNLGKNKTSAESDASDFVTGVERFGPLADILVINVSSPNTPGLRDLQKRDALKRLLGEVVTARDNLAERQPSRKGQPGSSEESSGAKKVPLVVKISPDLSEGELDAVVSTVLSSGIEGVIISNTTIQRPTSLAATLPQSELSILQETGGLSGPPLRPIARKALQRIAPKLRAAGVEVIAAGGITTPEDVLQASRDGASAIQVYTAFGWQGVGMVSRWKEELRALLASTSSPTSFAGGAKGLQSDNGKSTTLKLLAREVLTSLAAAEAERKKAEARAFDESGGEVRRELERLRKSIKGDASSSSATSPASATGADVGLGDIWFPDEEDEEYNSLLASTRRALGFSEPSRPSKAVGDSSVNEESTSPSRSDMLIKLRQRSAKMNPLDATSAPPIQVLQASGGTSNPTEATGWQQQSGQGVVFVNQSDEPVQVKVQPIRGASPATTEGKVKGKVEGLEGKANEWKQWAGIDSGRSV